jgi:hypothetical protein
VIRFSVKGEKFEYDGDKLPLPDAIALTKYCGMGIKEWGAGVSNDDPVALAALYWLASGRQGKFSDVLEDPGIDLVEMLRTWQVDTPAEPETPGEGPGNAAAAVEAEQPEPTST